MAELKRKYLFDRAGNLNIFNETIVLFGDVAVSATQIVDLGTDFPYHHISIDSTLNRDVILTFNNDRILTIDNKDGFAYSDFLHNGVLKLHYSVDPPSAGRLRIRSW